jgi:putative membrane protein
MTSRKGPVVIDLDEAPVETPATVEPVPDLPTAAMEKVAAMAGYRPSRLARWFWSALAAFVGFVASLAAYDYVNGLLTRSPVLGGVALALLAAVLVALAVMALRELWAFGRMRRLDGLRKRADAALSGQDLRQARDVVDQLKRLYAGRKDTQWGISRLAEREAEVLDADGLIGLAEQTLVVELDDRARAEVEAAARQVATVTALVPIALADLFTALTANLRMIRRISEIYGGRSGTLGSWRLTRRVLTHLVATGAVAVGDDMLGAIAGGGVAAKLSRRFGEGVINGALTARVGVAAIEVCRPLPFVTAKPPNVRGLIGRALTGFFAKPQ